MGGDATENCDFHRVKQRLQGSKNFHKKFFISFYVGDDATENGDFQIGKQRLDEYNFF